MKLHSVITHSVEETQSYAAELAKTLKAGSVLCLHGDLGSGKTSFVKGLASGLGFQELGQVRSPTFVVMNIYDADKRIFHYDCYRLTSEAEFEETGFEDFLKEPNAVYCLEWPEKAGNAIPEHAIHLYFETLDLNSRSITLKSAHP